MTLEQRVTRIERRLGITDLIPVSSLGDLSDSGCVGPTSQNVSHYEFGSCSQDYYGYDADEPVRTSQDMGW